jgi:phage head maturation protease
MQDDLLLAESLLLNLNPRDFTLSGYFSVFNTDAGTVDDLKEAVEQEVFSTSIATSQAVRRFFLFSSHLNAKMTRLV